MRSEYAWLPPHEGFTVTGPNQIGISFSEHRAVVCTIAGREREIAVPGGRAFITGREAIVWTRVRELTEALEIYPDLDFVGRFAARAGASKFEIEPAAVATDTVVFAVASLLKRAHAVNAYISDAAANTLAHRIAGHLLETYCGVKLPPLAHLRRLSRARVERVREHVDAYLAETLTLDRLAALVDLSPFHFARAFKQATGVAPHQFVTLRRIERAKRHLLYTRQTVQSVAYAVGFANLSHFRRVFRAHTGRLPSELREH